MRPAFRQLLDGDQGRGRARLTQIKAGFCPSGKTMPNDSAQLTREGRWTVPRDERDRAMWDYVRLIALGAIAVLAAIAANYAHDVAYAVNALTIMLAAAITFVWYLRQVDEPRQDLSHEYNDGVVRAGAIATAPWGVVGSRFPS